jgi:hypothetical protein
MFNYRPIPLLTCFSEIFEKVIYPRLYQHLIDNNIFVNEQFEFRANSSTDKATYKLLKEILNALNNKLMVGGVFCDLEKAFDCVNHILLSKLKFYGVNGTICKLIKSYLQDRFQRVVIDFRVLHSTTTSDWGKISHGVPQGSILGPLLFLYIYINNLQKIIINNSISVPFADDTSVIITNSNQTGFQKDIKDIFEHLNTWVTLNLLSLNSDKTIFIHFKTKDTRNLNVKVEYDNRFIANTYFTRFLELTTNNKLYWKSHTDQLSPNLSTVCYAIRVIKPLTSQETLVIIYYAYFHSIMNYGIICWGHSSYNINIFRLQKKAIRIITNSRNRDSCRDLVKTLKILPLQSQYIFSLLCFVVKNMDQYKVNLDIHGRNTRQSSNLHQTTSNLSLYQRGTYYMGIKIFNSLPSYIKDLSHNIKQFKLVLDNFLYLNSFYTLNEY